MDSKNGVVETRYGNGKLDGLSESWNANGQLRESIMYKDGIKQ